MHDKGVPILVVGAFRQPMFRATLFRKKKRRDDR
jgi:hypothetical protein